MFRFSSKDPNDPPGRGSWRSKCAEPRPVMARMLLLGVITSAAVLGTVSWAVGSPVSWVGAASSCPRRPKNPEGFTGRAGSHSPCPPTGRRGPPGPRGPQGWAGTPRTHRAQRRAGSYGRRRRRGSSRPAGRPWFARAPRGRPASPVHPPLPAAPPAGTTGATGALDRRAIEAQPERRAGLEPQAQPGLRARPGRRGRLAPLARLGRRARQAESESTATSTTHSGDRGQRRPLFRSIRMAL